MNETICKRKSIRKYDLTPLDAAALEKVQMQIENVTPLYPEIRYSVEIVNKTKGMFNIKAPHYLIFGSEEKDGSLTIITCKIIIKTIQHTCICITHISLY